MNGIASRPWLIVPVCSAVHVTFGFSCLTDASVNLITAINLTTQLFGDVCPYVFFFCGLFAMTPMFWSMSAVKVHLCLWPQQLMLFLMCLSVLETIVSGRYPDGYVASSRVFIFADQCYVFYLMIGHLAATVRNARFS